MLGPEPKSNPTAIVLWALASDPVIFAVVGLVIRSQGLTGALAPISLKDPLLIAFAVVALALAWFSFTFAEPTATRVSPGSAPLPGVNGSLPQRMIIAQALAISPGILGFVHYLLFGQQWVLLAFNGGAFALAVYNIAGRSK